MSIPQAVINEVSERAGGGCEACGRFLGPDGGVFHHRQLRKHGGPDTAINLMEVHPTCHNGHRYSIHGAPARSLRLHHIVSEFDDPADSVPIVELRLFQVHH